VASGAWRLAWLRRVTGLRREMRWGWGPRRDCSCDVRWAATRDGLWAGGIWASWGCSCDRGGAAKGSRLLLLLLLKVTSATTRAAAYSSSSSSSSSSLSSSSSDLMTDNYNNQRNEPEFFVLLHGEGRDVWDGGVVVVRRAALMLLSMLPSHWLLTYLAAGPVIWSCERKQHY
jgi:hypothetical protein